MNTELAWAAGFYDGEGCCFTRKCGQGGRADPSYAIMYLGLSVVQTDRRPLERFHSAVEGVGTIVGEGPKTNAVRFAKGWKPLYRWQCQSKSDVARVIELLWSYLSEPKREQIETARLAVAEHAAERIIQHPGRWAA